MSLAFMLLLQAGTTHIGTPLAIDFDLASYRPADSGAGPGACAGGGGDPETVIVCGPRRSGGDYPMAEMERLFAPRRFVAETGIAGNLRGDVHAEAVPMDRGAVSNRIMVELKLPF